MTDMFVPDYRVLDGVLVRDNTYSDRWRAGSPLYAMRFGVMFPFAISAGTFGIARGAVRAAWEHIEARVSSQGSVSKADPFVLTALARAEADVEASISHVQSIIARFHDTVAGGGDITVKDRLRFRVDQVRATDRAIEAVNELYRLMGSSSIQKGSPLERYWRDLQVASTHVCNSREPCYVAWGLDASAARSRRPPSTEGTGPTWRCAPRGGWSRTRRRAGAARRERSMERPEHQMRSSSCAIEARHVHSV